MTEEMTMEQLTLIVREKLKDYILTEKELLFSEGRAFLFGEGVMIVVRKHWNGYHHIGTEVALTFSGRYGIRKVNQVYKIESIHNAASRAIGIVAKVKLAREAEEKAIAKREAIKRLQKEDLSGIDLHYTIHARRYYDGSYKIDVGAFLSLEQLKQLNQFMHNIQPIPAASTKKEEPKQDENNT